MKANVGMSSDVLIRLEEDPTCIEMTSPASSAARNIGCQ